MVDMMCIYNTTLRGESKHLARLGINAMRSGSIVVDGSASRLPNLSRTDPDLLILSDALMHNMESRSEFSGVLADFGLTEC